MSFGRTRFFNRLSFRLSLWCGTALLVSSALSFVVFYSIMVAAMRGRTDTDLSHDATRLVETWHAGGLAAVAADIDKQALSRGANDVFYRVLGRDGTALAATSLAGWTDVGVAHRWPVPAAWVGPAYEYWPGPTALRNVRVLTAPLDAAHVVQIGYCLRDDQLVIAQAQRSLGMVTVGVVIWTMGLGWLLTRRALRGVQTIAATARQIAHGALDLRVSVSGRGDEIDALAGTFNHMLERIKQLVDGMKQTNDNIAHELRSPITRIRGLAETTLLGAPTPEDYQAMAANTIEGCDRLLGIINTMLDIAEGEAGVMPLQITALDLAALAGDACEIYTPVARERGITVRFGSPETCRVRGDLRHLQRALANLVDNAIKYAPEGGAVTVMVTQDQAGVHAAITNTGENIAPEDLPHLFERFYRGRGGRTQPGNGLGLSLAQAIIRAHGGNIAVENHAPGEVRFTVTLPREGESSRGAA